MLFLIMKDQAGEPDVAAHRDGDMAEHPAAAQDAHAVAFDLRTGCRPFSQGTADDVQRADASRGRDQGSGIRDQGSGDRGQGSQIEQAAALPLVI
jgi:hypothetical protein